MTSIPMCSSVTDDEDGWAALPLVLSQTGQSAIGPLPDIC